MSNDMTAVDEGFHGDMIARSASVPMVTEEKLIGSVTSKEMPLDHIKSLDLCNSRIRRFSSGSMIMSLSSPKISRLSPARLEQIKYEELDPFVMQEIAHERATCSNLQIAQLMTKDWSLCEAETSSDASSSTESSSVAAASSLSSGIQTSGGVSPTVAKFPSPLSVLSPSPPPYSMTASSVPNRIRAASRCHKRSQSPKVVPALTFSSSANASPASSTASGGANSPTTLTPHHSGAYSLLIRPSSLRGSVKRRYDGPSLFYHHTTPSASIGTGVAASSDPDSPSQPHFAFRKSSLLIPAVPTSAPNGPEVLSAMPEEGHKDQSQKAQGDECQPAKIKRPSSFASDVCSSSMSETESSCSTPASSTPQSQISLLSGKETLIGCSGGEIAPVTTDVQSSSSTSASAAATGTTTEEV